MNLDEAVERLDALFAEVRQALLIDDKTTLGSVLALRREERLINEGASEFDVVVFGDLNDFKHLNDEHGHDAGNVALRKVGETINTLVGQDLPIKAFRQSGDEFVILLKRELIEGFVSTSSSAFGKIPFIYNEAELRTAMSFGYAISDGKASFSDLLGRAEVACQYAKVRGDGACIEWTSNIELNPLVRLGSRCEKCGARISCNVSQQSAPLRLGSCPCCGELLPT